jgi:Ca2+-binding EF-hand superfamily protein
MNATDINQDGVVNTQDLVLIASHFGQSGQVSADVNGDGVVNILDLVLVAGAFGDMAAATSVQSKGPN